LLQRLVWQPIRVAKSSVTSFATQLRAKSIVRTLKTRILTDDYNPASARGTRWHHHRTRGSDSRFGGLKLPNSN
jgi:hypothetical protein